MKLEQFNIHGDRLDLGRQFEKWLERFERELKYNGCDPAEKPDTARMALLIYGGTDIEDIHDTIPDPTKPEGLDATLWTTYKISRTKLLTHFTPRKCNDFAIYQLTTLRMKTDETIETFTLRLRKAAEKCDFTNWSAEKMIKALLIANMRDEDMRLKLLQKERTLGEILDKARKKADAMERGRIMDKKETGGCSGLNKVDQRGKRRPFNRQPEAKSVECNRCGYEAHFKGISGPALTREGNVCHRMGHFANKCPKSSSKPSVRKVDTAERKADSSDTEDSDGYLSKKIDVLRVGKNISLMKVLTDGTEIRWQPDTGTQKDIWDLSQLKAYEEMKGSRVELQTTDTRLFPYGSDTSLTVVGKFPANLRAGDKMVDTTIYVTKEESTHPLLSEESAIALGLVAYNQEFMVKQMVTDAKRMTQQEAMEKYPDVFADRIGKSVARQVEIMIDQTVTPIVQKPRRIPVNLLDKAEHKVNQLLEEDIIEGFPDNEPRTWVSPPVIAPKPSGEIRFCIDMRLAN